MTDAAAAMVTIGATDPACTPGSANMRASEMKNFHRFNRLPQFAKASGFTVTGIGAIQRAFEFKTMRIEQNLCGFYKRQQERNRS
jgi:hypothetical protein